MTTTQRIAIATDSTCDLDRELIGQLGLRVIPVRVIHDGHDYRDGIDITAEEVYKLLPGGGVTTSTPSHQEAYDFLCGIRDEGHTHVLSVNVSGALSRTTETMIMASREVTGLTVEVVDSKTVSMGTGFIAEQAARWLAEARLEFAELAARVRDLVPHTRIYCVLKTLEYLRRGGRVGSVAAAVAGVLDLKPIIATADDGRLHSVGRVRGRRQSLDEMFRLVQQTVEAGANKVAVLHGEAVEEAQALLARVRAELPKARETVFGVIGPAIGVHAGPGVVGFAVTRI